MTQFKLSIDESFSVLDLLKSGKNIIISGAAGAHALLAHANDVLGTTQPITRVSKTGEYIDFMEKTNNLTPTVTVDDVNAQTIDYLFSASHRSQPFIGALNVDDSGDVIPKLAELTQTIHPNITHDDAVHHVMRNVDIIIHIDTETDGENYHHVLDVVYYVDKHTITTSPNDHALHILLSLFMDKYDDNTFAYDNVDNFYAYLGYELELTHKLGELGIEGTSKLKEVLEQLYTELY